MKFRLFAGIFPTFCLGVLSALGLSAQITQNHPELCGGMSIPQLPPGLDIQTDISSGESTLTIQGTPGKLVIPNPIVEVQEVCSLPRNRAMIFGILSPAVYGIAIIDVSKLTLIDYFWGFDPLLSPDQHWLIMRKFHPPNIETPFTEEYLLYDIDNDARHNRAAGITLSDLTSVGRTVYPLGLPDRISEKIAVTQDQAHDFRSAAFVWSTDSHAVAFADSVQNSLSIVLVTIGQDRGIATFLHPVTEGPTCSSPAERAISISRLKFQPGDGQRPSREIEATLSESGCPAQVLLFSSDDFSPAPVEHYDRIKRKKSILKEPE